MWNGYGPWIARKSFNTKKLLIIAHKMSYTDCNYTFTLQTDVPWYTFATFLTKNFNGAENIIAHLTRSLVLAETSLTVTDLEYLSVLWSVVKVRNCLEGVNFEVISDQNSLLWFYNLKDPQAVLKECKEYIVPNFLFFHRRNCSCRESSFLPQHFWEMVSWNVTESEKFPEKTPCWKVKNGNLFKYVKKKQPDLTDSTSSWNCVALGQTQICSNTLSRSSLHRLLRYL